MDHFSLPVRLFVAFWSKRTVPLVHSIHSFANRKEIIIHAHPIPRMRGLPQCQRRADPPGQRSQLPDLPRGPEAIREDPLFRMLVDEGSLEASVTPVQKKQLEADPGEGADAAGRKRAPARKTAE